MQPLPGLTDQFRFCPTQGAAWVPWACRTKLASAMPTGLGLTLGGTQVGVRTEPGRSEAGEGVTRVKKR